MRGREGGGRGRRGGKGGRGRREGRERGGRGGKGRRGEGREEGGRGKREEGGVEEQENNENQYTIEKTVIHIATHRPPYMRMYSSTSMSWCVISSGRRLLPSVLPIVLFIAGGGGVDLCWHDGSDVRTVAKLS